MNKLSHEDFVPRFGQRGQAIVINVLDEEMFHNEHIPGSINVPLQSIDFLDQIHAAAPDRDKPVVVYSGGPDCPAWESAVKQLEEDGYRQVFAYTGGMEGWKEAGAPIESFIPDVTPKEEAARSA